MCPYDFLNKTYVNKNFYSTYNFEFMTFYNELVMLLIKNCVLMKQQILEKH